MNNEKYGITDAHYLCDSAIFNTETDEILRLYQVCDLLNQQDQKIQELEHLLSNCIEPKFKIGQEVWYVWNKSQRIPFRCIIDKIVYDSSKDYKLKYDSKHYVCMKEEHLFATEEKAKAKLEELQK